MHEDIAATTAADLDPLRKAAVLALHNHAHGLPVARRFWDVKNEVKDRTRGEIDEDNHKGWVDLSGDPLFMFWRSDFDTEEYIELTEFGRAVGKCLTHPSIPAPSGLIE